MSCRPVIVGLDGSVLAGDNIEEPDFFHELQTGDCDLGVDVSMAGGVLRFALGGGLFVELSVEGGGWGEVVYAVRVGQLS